tara:strand:+ start:7914 stop:8363 length:450 start_codon:yes stop_codon:yes gene_type:complete
MDDSIGMMLALEEAKKALNLDEVPVGAVITYENEVISAGHNLTFNNLDATAHAEILVIKSACKALNSSRLIGCKLFVTLEPCCMCAGAILQSRIPIVIYGASDKKSGVVESHLNIFGNGNLNHHTTIRGGIKSMESVRLLKKFFKDKRK